MKHTGAKNRRYTDDHWQSVPTRARFLCFLEQIPPVGNFAKIRARGRGGLLESMCRNLTRPSLSHGKARKPTPPLGLLHGEA